MLLKFGPLLAAILVSNSLAFADPSCVQLFLSKAETHASARQKHQFLKLARPYTEVEALAAVSERTPPFNWDQSSRQYARSENAQTVRNISDIVGNLLFANSSPKSRELLLKEALTASKIKQLAAETYVSSRSYVEGNMFEALEAVSKFMALTEALGSYNEKTAAVIAENSIYPAYSFTPDAADVTIFNRIKGSLFNFDLNYAQLFGRQKLESTDGYDRFFYVMRTLDHLEIALMFAAGQFPAGVGKTQVVRFDGETETNLQGVIHDLAHAMLWVDSTQRYLSKFPEIQRMQILRREYDLTKTLAVRVLQLPTELHRRLGIYLIYQVKHENYGFLSELFENNPTLDSGYYTENLRKSGIIKRTDLDELDLGHIRQVGSEVFQVVLDIVKKSKNL